VGFMGKEERFVRLIGSGRHGGGREKTRFGRKETCYMGRNAWEKNVWHGGRGTWKSKIEGKMLYR